MGKERARTFTGEVNEKGFAEDPEAWLRHYLRVCTANGWDTDRQKLGHVAVCLAGEAEAWYDTNAEWIERTLTAWEDFEREFVSRFRPVNYQEELLDRLRTPAQRVGESVRAYGDRYKRLFAQAAPHHHTLDDYKRNWISGLHGHLKREVLLYQPTTFNDAVVRAMQVENINLTMERDSEQFRSGRRPIPKHKSQSADIASAEECADQAAGLTASRRPTYNRSDPLQDDDNLLAKLAERLLLYVDHPSERVPSSPSTPERRRGSGPRPKNVESSQSKRGCWTCGGLDHYSFRCPRRKLSEKEPRREAHVAFSDDGDDSEFEKLLEALPAEKRKAPARMGRGRPEKKPRADLPNEDENMENLGPDAEERKKKKIIAFVKNIKDGNFSDEEMRTLALTLSHIPSGESFIDRLNSSSKTRAAMRRGLRLVEEETSVDAKAAHPDEQGSAAYCSATVGGVECKVIIDSGAGVCIIPESMLKKMGREVERPCAYSLSTANGDVQPLGETSQVEISIGPIVDYRDALVLPDTQLRTIIIGTNWLRANRVTIDFDNCELKFPNGESWPISLSRRKEKVYHLTPPLGKQEEIKWDFQAPSDWSTEIPIDWTSSETDEESWNLSDDSPAEYVKDSPAPVGRQLVESNGSDEKEEAHQEESLAITGESTMELSGDSSLSEQEPKTPLEPIEVGSTTSPDLTEDQTEKIAAVIDEAPFADRLEEFGHTNVVVHHIDTGEARPIRQRPYRESPRKREFLKEEIARLLELGIIRESESEWASPVVIPSKKDGSMRLCVDVRALNAVTKFDPYPMPRVDDLLDKLAGAKWFSTLDLKSGFWQVELAPEDCHKTAFVTSFGLYEYTRMPMGLVNSPATFSRLMDKVLRGLIGKCALVYIDDVIVYSPTFELHLQHLREVMDRFRESNLTLNRKKCEFGQREVRYLGHVVSADGIRVDEEKVERVRSLRSPQNLREARAFVGLVGYYRRFIPKFAAVAAPITELAKKNRPFHWGQEQQEAFEQLKGYLTTAPVIAYPDFHKSFILQTDASDVALGAVLSQVGDDGLEHPVAYASRKLINAERNYSTTERECLAVVWGIRKFHHYIDGCEFTVETDHAALRWLLSIREPKGRLCRWICELMEHRFRIVTRPGRVHSNADAMSRLPTDEEPASEEAFATVVEGGGDLTLRFKGSKWSTLFHSAVKRKLNLVEESDDEEERPALRKRAARMARDLYVEDGVLRYKRDNKILPEPRELASILQKYHGLAHLGARSTSLTLMKTYRWPGMWKDTHKWIRQCIPCQLKSSPSRREELRPINVTGPFDRVGVDFVGPLPTTDRGHRYIIVAIDYLSKWVELRPTIDDTAETAAKFIFEEVICRHGCPKIIQSDRGSHFVNELWTQLTGYFGVEHKLSSPYHPQTNGLVERFNRTLKRSLKRLALTHGGQSVWDEDCAAVAFAARAMIRSETTGYTPFFLLYGREARHPFSKEALSLESPEGELEDGLEKRVGDLLTLQREIRDKALRRIAAQQQKMKERHDYQRSAGLLPPLHEGSTVLIHDQTAGPWESQWKGPYRVKQALGNGSYLLEALDGTPLKSPVHGNRLMEFEGEAEELLAGGPTPA